jgi:hypothetical protein
MNWLVREEIKNRINKIYSSGKGIIATVIKPTCLYNYMGLSPDGDGDQSKKLNVNDKLKCKEFIKYALPTARPHLGLMEGDAVDLVFVEKDSSTGYVIQGFLEFEDSLFLTNLKKVDSLDIVFSNIESESIIIDSLLPERERKDSLSSKYKKSRFKNGVINKKIKIGMTVEMVIDSWGKPEDIHRTVGNWGVHEQWIYGTTYLYFENNILTSFQD